MFALVVPLKVKPEMREKFLAAAQEDSTCSVRDEPGCLRFDVLRHNENPPRFAFYEVYKDEDAVKAHQQTEHYARWRREIEGLQAVPRTSGKFTTVDPAPYA